MMGIFLPLFFFLVFVMIPSKSKREFVNAKNVFEVMGKKDIHSICSRCC